MTDKEAAELADYAESARNGQISWYTFHSQTGFPQGYKSESTLQDESACAAAGQHQELLSAHAKNRQERLSEYYARLQEQERAQALHQERGRER